MVLRDGPRRGTASDDSERLPQPECRRSDEVSVCARSHPRGSWRRELAPATAGGRRSRPRSRDKINFHWDEQHACNGATFTSTGDGCRQQPESEAAIGPLGLGGLTSTTSPEIGGYLDTHPRVRLLTWQSTATNRMLFDAGFGAYQSPFGPLGEPGQHHAAARARDRAVRRRVHGEWRHSRT